MDRTEALRRWQEIADGGTNHPEGSPYQLEKWIREVARQIVEADQQPKPSDRISAIAEAVGLAGRHDTYAELREMIELVTEFSSYDATGKKLELTQAQELKLLVEHARKKGLLKGVYLEDPRRARDLVRDIWRKKV